MTHIEIVKLLIKNIGWYDLGIRVQTYDTDLETQKQLWGSSANIVPSDDFIAARIYTKYGEDITRKPHTGSVFWTATPNAATYADKCYILLYTLTDGRLGIFCTKTVPDEGLISIASSGSISLEELQLYEDLLV